MRSWNIAIGNFFFRYRNALFPLIFAIGALTIRPQIMFDSLVVDRILVVTGMVLALLGQAVRLVTIGFDYIHRGGKDGHVYAGRLVRGGVYGVTRNPMYTLERVVAVPLLRVVEDDLLVEALESGHQDASLASPKNPRTSPSVATNRSASSAVV